MSFLVLISLASVIPGVYKTEEPLGSCSKNQPFRMDDGICMNFTKMCIREENGQCKSMLNACSQCPPSGYTISMLATLNDKMNELSTLQKEITDNIPPISGIKKMNDSTKERVQLLPTVNDTINEISTLRKEIKELRIYGICLLALCIPVFIGIISIVYQVVKLIRCPPIKIDQAENVEMQQLIKGSKEERKSFIGNEPSTSASINMKYLKDDNIIKSSSVKTAQDLNIRQDIENISSRLDQMNRKLDTQAENIKHISSQVNKLIERSDAQAQNSQNVPNEDMKNIYTSMVNAIETFQDQEAKRKISDAVPEGYFNKISKDKDHRN